MTRSGHTQLAPSPLGRVVAHGSELFVVAADGGAKQVSGDSAELVRAILGFVDRVRSRAEIVTHLEALAGGPIEHSEVIDEALALLTDAGVLVPPLHPAPVASRGRLVLGVSGAVAASGAPELVARLQRAGFEVRVALTREARRFVSPLVLEALTHQPVPWSLWPRGATVPHIALAEWAELMLICPASATTLSRLATGDCSDLVAAIAVGTRAPRLIVPSMNEAMYRSAPVSRNLQQLRDDGCWLAQGALGEELAHPPGQRTPAPGGMPAPAAVVDLACFIAARR